MKKLLAVSALIGFGVVAHAGEAVSGLNGKAGFFSGNMDGDNGNNLEGSLSFPLSSSFGVQVDGFYSDVVDSDYYGMGAHLFWRNSEKGLFGVTAGAIRENEILDSWAGGAEFGKKADSGIVIPPPPPPPPPPS